MATTRTHVPLTVTASAGRDGTVYRLTSPTGRVLTITDAQLAATLYGFGALLGRGGRLSLPVATVAALSRLGTVEEPATPPTQEVQTP
jgi:hypothetical protein